MAEFTPDLQSFIPSFPFLDIGSMELLNQSKGVNPHLLDDSNFDIQNLMSFSIDSFFGSTEPEFPGSLEENFSGLVHCVSHNEVPVSLPMSSAENDTHEDKKRKAMDIHMRESSSAKSTPAISESRKNSFGRGKKAKRNVTEDKETKEVVHVRARRGQATDSHSLAERVRRGKINEKLKRLRNMVPGCYKTMGMAIMLDEIINYVQSLQHQVEFLSMKLTAASTIYNFNSDTDVLETTQRARASEAKDLTNYVRDGYGGVSSFQPTWPWSL